MRQKRRLAWESFIPSEQRNGPPSSASRLNNRVSGELFPALRLHEDDPGTVESREAAADKMTGTLATILENSPVRLDVCRLNILSTIVKVAATSLQRQLSYCADTSFIVPAEARLSPGQVTTALSTVEGITLELRASTYSGMEEKTLSSTLRCMGEQYVAKVQLKSCSGGAHAADAEQDDDGGGSGGDDGARRRRRRRRSPR